MVLSRVGWADVLQSNDRCKPAPLVPYEGHRGV